MRRRKFFVSVLLAAILVIDAVLLWSSGVHDKAKELGTYLLHIGFDLYTLGLALHSVHQDTSLHSKTVLHLTTLTTLASVLLGSIAIVPDSSSITIPASETMSILQRLFHARLGLYITLCAVTLTTRLGPPLWYSLDRIYTEKTRLAGTISAGENVSGSVGMSILVNVQTFTYIYTQVTLFWEYCCSRTLQRSSGLETLLQVLKSPTCLSYRLISVQLIIIPRCSEQCVKFNSGSEVGFHGLALAGH